MKKVLLGWVAIAGMLFASSCSKETEMPAASGNEVTLSLNVGVERVLSTRAISDGTGANKLVYQILDATGAPVGDVVTKESVSFPVQETVTLIKGKTYKMVAWAQNGSCAAYDLEAFPTVSVDYTGAVNNDETRDAFFKTVEFEVYDGMESVSVTLKRPFAQINVGTLQETAIVKSSMVVKGGYSEIDLTDGSVAGGLDEITFAAAEVPSEDLKVKAADEETAYKWLSMSYVLINEKENLEVTFSFENEAGEPINELNVPAVPVERNHRTNLLGTFTVDVDFDIDTDGGYDDGDNNEDVDFTKPGEGGEDPEEPTDRYISDAIFVENITGTSHEVMAEGSTVNGENATGVKFGASSKGGFFTSAPVAVTGNYTLTFYGAAWTTETSPVYVRVNNGGSVSGSNNSMLEGGHNVTSSNKVYTITDITEANKYSFSLIDLTPESTITISSNENFANEAPKARGAVFGIKLTEGEGGSTEPEEPTFTVSEVKAEYAEGSVTFSAKFVGEKESIESAYFVYGPATRAAESGKVEATVGEGVLTAKTTLTPGNYTVTVEINDKIVESTTADEDTATVVVPEEEPEQPGDDEKGSLKNPLTVAEAIAKALETGETPTEDYYYIKGRIEQVTEQFSANFGNATFTMKDEGSSDVFTAYRVYYKATSQKWTAGDETVNPGDEVIVYGQIMNYKGNTPETNQNTGYLVEIVEYAPTIETFDVNYDATANTVTLSATYTNKSDLSLKTGFVYEGTAGAVDVPVSANGGTFSTVIDTKDFAFGTYNVSAYVNDIKSAPKSFTIQDPNAGEAKEYVDILNNAWTGVGSTTNYTSWTKNGSASEAVYVGQSAGDSGTIQLRSNNNNSGVVTTVSGGSAKKIVVTWNSTKTAAGRTLDVYGSNSAYTDPTDLYATNKQGTKIGSIVYGDSTELVIDGNYTYIGFRSSNAAMYFDEIQITWEK